MVGDERLDRPLQQIVPQRLTGLEQQGVVEVVRVRRLPLEQVHLDGREGHVAHHRSLLREGRLTVASHGRQRAQGGVLEEVLHLQPHPGLPRPGHHLEADDGVAAQREEVVVQAHAIHAQHLRQHLRQRLLPPRARRDVLAARIALALRRGQRLAVHLVLRRQRQRIQRDEHRRQHVVRHPLAHELAQDLRLRDGRGDDVGHEPLVSGRVLAHHGHGLAHVWMRGQGGLHLRQLDAEAAHLHLVVGAAQEVQHPVRPPARQVARAVEALTG
nr:hypothetical protein [Corallococcus sp. CA049B]